MIKLLIVSIDMYLNKLKLLNLDELGQQLLYPFKQLEIEEQCIEKPFDIQQRKLILDVKEIWCPRDSSISFNDWVTKITKQLLESLPGFCKSLLPIAENKVKHTFMILL